MSPEQVRGETIDKRADIWAFGCLLFETLRGKSAFGRETLADTLAAIVDQEPGSGDGASALNSEPCTNAAPRQRYLRSTKCSHRSPAWRTIAGTSSANK